MLKRIAVGLVILMLIASAVFFVWARLGNGNNGGPNDAFETPSVAPGIPAEEFDGTGAQRLKISLIPEGGQTLQIESVRYAELDQPQAVLETDLVLSRGGGSWWKNGGVFVYTGPQQTYPATVKRISAEGEVPVLLRARVEGVPSEHLNGRALLVLNTPDKRFSVILQAPLPTSE